MGGTMHLEQEQLNQVYEKLLRFGNEAGKTVSQALHDRGHQGRDPWAAASIGAELAEETGGRPLRCAGYRVPSGFRRLVRDYPHPSQLQLSVFSR